MNAQQLNVSVIDPIGPTFERVKTILFRPFDLGKWFVIGFCAWLAYLGKGGGGGGGGGGRGSHFQHGVEPREALHAAKEYVLYNLHWIVPVAVIAVLVGIILWLVLTWLSSRGRFMFLHCVALNKAEVKVPWAKFRQHANSLFLFRIVLDLIGFAAIGVPLLIAGLLIAITIAGNGPHVVSVLGFLVIGLIVFAISIAFILVHKFTMDFVVPIMFLRTTSCTGGWREFLRLLSANKARFALYILFQIVIAIAIGAIILAAVCITCCCACCILTIPYIGTILMLPLLVFKRAYSLLYFRQFGPQFDVFSPETQAA
ncbi:MAG: DUF7544 domain-containing protein [Planctomycetota bacterium]|jgi:hypothetical protein